MFRVCVLDLMTKKLTILHVLYTGVVQTQATVTDLPCKGKKAVTVYFLSKQLLPYGFEEQ